MLKKKSLNLIKIDLKNIILNLLLYELFLDLLNSFFYLSS
jgi:hypothetical protein